MLYIVCYRNSGGKIRACSEVFPDEEAAAKWAQFIANTNKVQSWTYEVPAAPRPRLESVK